jgi:DNA polymerase III sliding clamp (beta) subunit (PCNA family)
MTATDTATHTILARDLKAALARVAPAIGARSSIQVLACVRIGDGLLTATNMEATISAPLEAAIGFESVLASAADLKRVLSACKPADAVTLERIGGTPASGWEDGETIGEGTPYESKRPGRWKVPAVMPTLALETPNGRVVLPGFDLEDWPTFADPDYPHAFAPTDPARFASVLQDVSGMASGDESRPSLTCTMLEARASGDMRLISTDSYRLGVDVEDGSCDGREFRALAPFAGKYLAKFAGIESVESTHGHPVDASGADPALVRFTDADGVTCTLRQVQGQYPNVDQLVPNSWEHECYVPAGMPAAVKFAGKMLASNKNPLMFAFDEDGFDLSASVQDGAKTSKRFDAGVSGDIAGLQIGFNADFLQDGLAFVGEDATLKLISALRPGLLTSNDRVQRAYLIMPVRLPG